LKASAKQPAKANPPRKTNAIEKKLTKDETQLAVVGAVSTSKANSKTVKKSTPVKSGKKS
jgi:hypothetical protein